MSTWNLIIAVLYAGLLWACTPQGEPKSQDEPEKIILAAQKQAKAGRVHLAEVEGSYRLIREGLPYYIKGIAGRENLELAIKLGANSIRTWYTEGMDELLDMADSLDMTVLIGLEIGRQRLGFDYGDEAEVAAQEAQIVEWVERYKSHPAVLGWIVGNEPDLLAAEDIRVWQAIHVLVDKIHQIDPEHPVTICSRPDPIALKNIKTYCANIDFLTVNVFDKIGEFPQLLAESTGGWNIPYVLGEWGAMGYWQAAQTDWFAPVEPNTAEKVNKINSYYQTCIKQDAQHCMGAYIFYWGQKQERTHTWFSLFMESGEKTAMVDAVSKLWGGEVNNWAPVIDSMAIKGFSDPYQVYLSSGTEYEAHAVYRDPDADSLFLFWEVLPEGNYANKVGGDKELRPYGLPDLVEDPQMPTLRFQAPEEEGAYRLFLYCYDKKGGAAASNLPFYVFNQKLE